MSESNGKLPASPYRQAVELHRAQRAAWKRLQAARNELDAAAVAYNSLRWADLPAVNGLVELAESETLPAAELNGLRTDLPDAEAAELPAGGPAPKPKRERKKKDPVPPIPPALAERGVTSWCDLHKPIQPEEPSLQDAALDRLGQMLDRTLPDRKPAEQQPTDGLPPWTSDDLERELLHALGCGGLNAYIGWGSLITGGASDDEINEKLDAIWPPYRKFVKPGADRKLGYSIVCGTSQSVFWLGEFRGPGHRPTLAGKQLVDRIRAVLEIPTPTQARKAAQASFKEPAQDTFREVAVRAGIPMNPPSVSQKKPGGPVFVAQPPDGWEDADFHNAAEDLATNVNDLAICEKCQAVRNRAIHPCPSCKSPTYRLYNSPGTWGAPAYKPPVRGTFKTPPPSVDQPVKRGRGRPPGSKTRKAVISG
jgi:hypothetical protein